MSRMTVGVLCCLGSILAWDRVAQAAEANEVLIELVEQLGSESFADRELAEQSLRQIGIPALALLLAARDDNPDAEVRRRAERLVPAIEAADHESRLQAFQNDLQGTNDYGLAGWSRFAKIVGVDADARALFAAMHQAEPLLMRQADGTASRVSAVFHERLADILRGGSRGRPLAYQQSVPTSMAFFFVGSRNDILLADNLAGQVVTLTHGPAVAAAMQAENGRRTCMEKLMTEWVISRSQGWTGLVNLNLAQRFQLREAGHTICRELLSRVGGEPSLRGQALMGLERFGTIDDLPLVESCLTDSGACLNFTQKDRRLVIEVREVALAVAVLLTKADADEFGLSNLQRINNKQLLLNSLDLGEGEELDRLVQKWRDRSATAKGSSDS